MKACGALAPASGITLCRDTRFGVRHCQKVAGHPGPHSSKPSSCNRPFGHEGPHTFVVARDAHVLARWT